MATNEIDEILALSDDTAGGPAYRNEEEDGESLESLGLLLPEDGEGGADAYGPPGMADTDDDFGEAGWNGPGSPGLLPPGDGEGNDEGADGGGDDGTEGLSDEEIRSVAFVEDAIGPDDLDGEEE